MHGAQQDAEGCSFHTTAPPASTLGSESSIMKPITTAQPRAADSQAGDAEAFVRFLAHIVACISASGAGNDGVA